MSLSLSNDYGLVIAAAGVIGLTQFIIGGGVMKYRGKFFNTKDFREKPAVVDMIEEHKKSFTTELSTMGYPDMGCGRYSAHLSYSQWVEINNAQRAHYNMIESSAPMLACMLATGLRLPRVCAALGTLYALGRFLYFKGYTSSAGSSGRNKGALTAGLSMLALMVTTVVVGVATAAGY